MNHMCRTILPGVMILLAACGGGGETLGGPNASAPPVVNLASTTVTVESSVPVPVVNAIAEVVSPVDSGQISSPIQIISTGGHDSFVLALDAAGKIRLAAMSSGGPTTLNADSTALALVRMAIGTLPPGITASQVNQTIRGTAEFPALEILIQGALDITQAPLDSGPVVQGVATSVRQAMSAIAALVAPAPVSAGPSVLAFASQPVTTPLPFKIVSNIASLFSVYVSSTGSGGSVNVVNASPLVWSAHSLDEIGRLIPSSSTEDGKVLLDSNTVTRSLLDKVHPWLGPPAVSLPGNSEKGLDIVVEQTTLSHKKNLEEILQSAFATVVPINLGNECLNSVAKALHTAGSLDDLAKLTTFDAVKDALLNARDGDDAELEGVIARCIPSLSPKRTEVGRFTRLVTKTLVRLAGVQAFDDAATLVAKVVLTATNWSLPPKAVAVCMGESGLSSTPSIQNCAVEFTFENATPILAPNARFTPRITALTSGGVPTGLPIGITYASSDLVEAVVTVVTPPNGGRQTGELVANGVGSATITARDPFTNTSGQYTATVVRPRITPGVVRMGVGQSMTLNLTDANNQLVITDQSGIRWTSSDETRVALGPFSSGSTNTATIVARAPGRVTITVTNPVLLSPTTADVEVTATPVNVCEPDVPSYTPSGCELPRLVAKNPFTPLQAGQAVPISELFEYRPGTCSQITQMLFALPLRSSEYSFEGLQDPSLYEHHNLVPFSFLPGPDLPALEPSSVRLRPNTSTERSIGVGKIVFQYRRHDPLGQFPAVYHGNFQCIFSLRSSP